MAEDDSEEGADRADAVDGAEGADEAEDDDVAAKVRESVVPGVCAGAVEVSEVG